MRRLFPVVLGLVLACSGSDPAAPSVTGVPDATDAVSPTDVAPEVHDSGTPGPGADGTASGLDGSAPDAPAEDTGPIEGGFGWPCNVPDDCTSGYCVPSPDGLVCTDFCSQSCPSGWTCSPVGQGGPDTQFICVQRTLNLCRPCITNKDCATVSGVFDDYCVSYGAVDGSFCGTGCYAHSDCPEGYQCVEALQATDGSPIFQCVPVSGQCECSKYAIQQSAETTCLTVGPTGNCPGHRVCAPGGLTACDAAQAGAESCNGIDDDCDGLTDEEQGGTPCDLKNAYGTCPGETICNGGVPQCSGKGAEPESCNGKDDNCNGAIDEGSTDTDQDGTADCTDIDDDDDGWQDDVDDCPLVWNPDQLNSDFDGLGDLCDPDDDNDNVLDAKDNCALLPNPEQLDGDGDGIGNLCDSDVDGDLVFDEVDNCPKVANADQADFDLDGTGDECDPDDDADNIIDTVDNCTAFPNPDQSDLDEDQKGDLCDSDMDGDGKYNAVDNCKVVKNTDQSNFDGDLQGDLCDDDDDNDGVVDTADDCPKAFNPEQLNTDADGVGDACDPDDDNDEVLDGKDNCTKIPNIDQIDSDKDGQGDLCDGDSDGDKIPDLLDNCPLDPNKDQVDADGDKKGDACDGDDDGDLVPDLNDNCPIFPNPEQLDLDEDTVGDACDPDKDGDGVSNGADNCPTKSNASQADLNQNGIGDVCDDDDDADGVPDVADNCPLSSNPDQEDHDSDGLGDKCDADDDNDGKPDLTDNCPALSNADQLDTDADGAGNACDDDDDGDGDPDITDCGPTDPNAKHGAQEVCNGIDDNCVFGADEEGAQGCASTYIDKDGDGWGIAGASKCLCLGGKGEFTATQSGDCDDANQSIHPLAAELCNGVDDNCDSTVDPQDAGGCTWFYYDGDGDGWGTSDKLCTCKASGKYKAAYQGEYDCNDTNPNISPGAAEVCGGMDEDCDGKFNEDGAQGCKTLYPDADGDGYGAQVAGKCTCTPTAGYTVENNQDCYDGNKYAYPGNGGWYTSHRGDGSFDYDCDGAETKEHTLTGGNCSTILGFCSATQKGFTGGIPPCGGSGEFLDGCNSGFFSCKKSTTSVQQRCH